MYVRVTSEKHREIWGLKRKYERSLDKRRHFIKQADEKEEGSFTMTQEYMVNWSHWKDKKTAEDQWGDGGNQTCCSFWSLLPPEHWSWWSHFYPCPGFGRHLHKKTKQWNSERKTTCPEEALTCKQTYGTWHLAWQGSQCSCQNPCCRFHHCIYGWSSGTGGHWEGSLQMGWTEIPPLPQE